MITEKSSNIIIDGYYGIWYVIGTEISPRTQKPIFLLEHEEYGDEAAALIVDEDGKILLEDVWNGFDDLHEAWECEALPEPEATEPPLPKFTPGPWKANIHDLAMGDTGDVYTERTVEDKLNICVCQVFEHDNKQHTGEEQADANVHLIAAAPVMYDLLQSICIAFSPNEENGACRFRPDHDCPNCIIEQTLKRARGEA